MQNLCHIFNETDFEADSGLCAEMQLRYMMNEVWQKVQTSLVKVVIVT